MWQFESLGCTVGSLCPPVDTLLLVAEPHVGADRERTTTSETGLRTRVPANTATANVCSLSASVLSTRRDCVSNYEPILSAEDVKGVSTALVAATSPVFIHAFPTPSSSMIGRGVSAMRPGVHIGPTTPRTTRSTPALVAAISPPCRRLSTAVCQIRTVQY